MTYEKKLNTDTAKRNVAFYYPGAMWTSGTWIKTLLLFFDSVALIARDASYDPSSSIDMTVAEPLFEKGLLQIVDLHMLVEEEITKNVWAVLQKPESLSELNVLGKNKEFYYGSRVYDTLNGPEPSIEMMEMRNDLLREVQAGVAVREYGNEPKLSIDIRLWAPLLSTIPHILKPGGAKVGMTIQPVTQQVSSIMALKQLLSLSKMPSAEQVIAFEPEQVVLDLASIPLDDILLFREQHGQQYQTYAQQLHLSVKQLGLLHTKERSQALLERREELAVQADGLRSLARRYWKRPLATFGLGILGSAWKAQGAHDPAPPFAELIGYSDEDTITSCYSYLFTTSPTLLP